MSTMIITTDNQTITRMAVIAKRTDSEFMAGAKAMMVESLKRQMRGGVAHFVYQKKNGELREAEFYCTTAYFDVEKGAWRSFRWESIVTVF